MTTYKELLAQRQALEEKINEARRRETKDAISRVKAIMVEFELSPEDIFPSARKPKGVVKSKAPAKYLNPQTNETWTGRGRSPNWIKGKNADEFLIKS
ncbi:MAG TPA: H-NS histone family protein [Burkholderiaceae bacterium]|nr:H-NS histone family protein [Burkholderiaceae bacterium]